MIIMSVCLLISCSNSSQAQDINVSILTYNIYYGGQDYGDVTGRDDEWLSVMIDYSPDIILIQEANGWLPGDDNLIAQYVTALNLALPEGPAYTGYVGDANSTFDLALISRVPVTNFQIHNAIVYSREIVYPFHGFIHAELAIAGQTAHLIGVHFKSGTSRDIRLEEAYGLLAIIDQIPIDEPIWIGGDFNSYSPVDVEDGSPTQPDYAGGAMGAELIGWEPVGLLLERGYIDTVREADPFLPAYTKETESFLPNTLGPFARVDFILQAPGSEWALSVVETVTGGIAEFGSDHYAIYAEFDRPDPAAVAPVLTDMEFGLRVYPNPISDKSRIRYQLERPGYIRAILYDAEGRTVERIVNQFQAAGSYLLPLSRAGLAGSTQNSGLYWLRISGAARSETIKLIKP